MADDLGTGLGRVSVSVPAPAPDATSPPGPALLTVGRINLDLYSEQLGVHMEQARTFRAMVGGSPTNIAIAATRLGTRSAVLSAAGKDPAGDLVYAQLASTGVDTRWVDRLGGWATSMALLATTAPDDGQRQFYRDNPADAFLDPRVVATLPWSTLRLVLLSADALARGTTPAVVAAVATEAARRGIPVWWDLDLRDINWPQLRAYAKAVRPAIERSTLVIGTEAEYAAMLGLTELNQAHRVVPALGLQNALVKTGARGAVLYVRDSEPLVVPATTTTPVCTVGGGDALAGALAHAHLTGQSWPQALDLAMCAAGWTVGQPGCSEGFPTLAQLAAAANSGRQVS